MTWSVRTVAGLLVTLALSATVAERADAGRWQTSEDAALARAVGFLAVEVPRWRAEEGCYSCHNNGDAARALIRARLAGHDVDAPLDDTLAFLASPDRWEDNSTGGAFEDKPLARLQFASALTAAVLAGLAPAARLTDAARQIVVDQQADGSWQLDPSNSLGSPATYGTALATWSARRTLMAAAEPDLAPALARANDWLRSAPVTLTPDAAAVLMALGEATDAEAIEHRRDAAAFLIEAQAPDGGWGPYRTSRSEPFDTAVAILALSSLPDQSAVADRIARGRAYLLDQMLPDGSWPETTRPAGQRSYAQLISTAGWATLALFETTATEGRSAHDEPDGGARRHR